MYRVRLQDSELVLPSVRDQATHVYHLYVVRSSRRDELYQFLRSKGIASLIHYPVPVHQQPAYKGRLAGCDRLGESERAASEVVSLPMYPEITDAEILTVISAICDFERGSSG